jgi:hypothetical protein
MHATSGDDPVRFEFEAPERVANWRPLVHWLLAIPHFAILYALNIASNIVWVISFFTVLFTEQIPEGLFRFQVMVHRYQYRTMSYAGFMRESYPAFEFSMSTDEPGGDPVSLAIDRPEKVNRWLPLVKLLLAIPHYIVLFVYAIGALFVMIAAFFAVLFTGKFPLGMRDYVVKVSRYALRVSAYIKFLRDEYPSFSLT